MLCAEDSASQADHVEARACYLQEELVEPVTSLFTEHFVNTEMKDRTNIGLFCVFKRPC